MTIAEKLTKIAENTPKVYDAGYKKGLGSGSGASVEFVESLYPIHMSTGFSVGDTINESYIGWEDSSYCVNKYKTSEPITDCKIKMYGYLSNSFDSQARYCVLLAHDGVVSVSQSNVQITPDDIYALTGRFEITIPAGVYVNQIYLNCDPWNSPPDLYVVK